MANLEKNIEEKLTEVFKGEFEKEDFELNYLITDDVITFFFPIAEGKELSLDSIELAPGTDRLTAPLSSAPPPPEYSVV